MKVRGINRARMDSSWLPVRHAPSAVCSKQSCITHQRQRTHFPAVHRLHMANNAAVPLQLRVQRRLPFATRSSFLFLAVWYKQLQNPSQTAGYSIFFYLPLGSFLGNNEAERLQMQLSVKTVSLWSHLNRPEVLRSFLNPLYEPNNRVIWPSVAPMSLVSGK